MPNSLIQNVKKVFLVRNPKAGRATSDQEWAKVRQVIENLRPEAVIEELPTHSFLDLIEKVKSTDISGGPDENLCVIAGGDGTISYTFRILWQNRPDFFKCVRFMLLPSGRGNDFYRNFLNLKSKAISIDKVFSDRLKKAKVTAVDLVEFNQVFDDGTNRKDIFANVLSFGFPGRVVQRVAQHARLFGFAAKSINSSGLTYPAHSLHALLEVKPPRIALDVDGRSVFEGPVLAAFVLNGAYNAGGFRWSRKTKPTDGQLQFIAVASPGMSQIRRFFEQLKKKDLFGVAGRFEWSGAQAVIRVVDDPNESKFPLFEFDGELPESEKTLKRLEFNVIPAAIYLIV